jgi:5'-methylthioadenosine phosphorylase
MSRGRAQVGVFGGSGFYRLLEDVEHVEVDTPYGPPSDRLVVADVAGRAVAFLPRHGRGHRWPPHQIPYRANLWALRSLGVRQIVAPCAVGSLRPDLPPGTIVVPDQLVDRTTSRVHTFYDSPAHVVHVGFADPYCPDGRAAALAAGRAAGWPPVDGGTLVVVEGPRFATRAESRWYAAQGWSVIGMTTYPEAALARELELCYTTIALVTDFDAGIETGEGVTQTEVFEVFAKNIERLRGLLLDVIPRLPRDRSCPCSRALDGLSTGMELP